MILIQWRYSRDALGAPLGIAMCVACVLLAPLSWRVLFPEGIDLGHGAIRLFLYGAIGAGVVLFLGGAVPMELHMKPTLMTARASLPVCCALFLVGGWGLGRDIGFEASLRGASESGPTSWRARRSTPSSWRYVRTSIRISCSTR